MATQRRHAGGDQARESPGAGCEHRVTTLEARVEHLERQLEGLQDALYRQAMLTDDKLGELGRRIEPERIARDLDQDARKRGL